jgi:RNA recognition motif-containing protein
MGRRLYVGNLPYKTTDEELTELFSRAGAVDNVRVMRDQATGRARGFAFVEMATDDDAQKAIDKFHNYEFGGRNLTVNEARPRAERSGGGGFGGGGYGGGGGGRGGGGYGGGGGGYGGGEGDDDSGGTGAPSGRWYRRGGRIILLGA